MENLTTQKIRQAIEETGIYEYGNGEELQNLHNSLNEEAFKNATLKDGLGLGSIDVDTMICILEDQGFSFEQGRVALCRTVGDLINLANGTEREQPAEEQASPLTVEIVREAITHVMGKDYFSGWLYNRLCAEGYVTDQGFPTAELRTNLWLDDANIADIVDYLKGRGFRFHVDDIAAYKTVADLINAVNGAPALTLAMVRDAIEASQGKNYLEGISDDELANQDLFNDLGLDSLDIAEIIFHLEQWGFSFDDESVAKCKTVTDLITIAKVK